MNHMRVLGIGHHCDLGDMYTRLVAREHDVRVHIDDPDSTSVFEGILRFLEQRGKRSSRRQPLEALRVRGTPARQRVLDDEHDDGAEDGHEEHSLASSPCAQLLLCRPL